MEVDEHTEPSRAFAVSFNENTTEFICRIARIVYPPHELPKMFIHALISGETSHLCRNTDEIRVAFTPDGLFIGR